ncbi:carboxypeptidase regulatory-like domain-containing protein [Candidatus Daviesbacteria bacterium]|nr:carboxypeptidase regulatory-like domain-containing protein [Candidatus Daviesbacteria bacterium]
MKRFLKLLPILSIAIFIFFILPKTSFASTFYLSPGGGSVYTGGVTSVQIRLSTGGDAVNGASAYLSYPADKLDVAWVSGGSAFAIEAEKSFGGGIIKVSRGSINPVSGDVNVATIGFKGKSAGSAAVSFIGGSAAPRASDSSDSLNLGGSRGGVYNVVAGGAPAKPAQASSTKASPGNNIAQLLISDIKATASVSSATIAWKTNGEADSVVEYGLEQDKYFLNASDAKLTLDHSLKLENAFLTPGLKLHFRIKSKDAEGHETSSEDQILQLLGYQVKVKVVDEAGNPLSGVEVWLYSEPVKAVTDANGEATFDNVSPGKHLAVVKSGDGDRSTEIEVSADSAPVAASEALPGTASGTAATVKPAAVIKISSAAKQPVTLGVPQQILAVLVITIILAAAGAVVILKRRKKQGSPPNPEPYPKPPAVNNTS